MSRTFLEVISDMRKASEAILRMAKETDLARFAAAAEGILAEAEAILMQVSENVAGWKVGEMCLASSRAEDLGQEVVDAMRILELRFPAPPPSRTPPELRSSADNRTRELHAAAFGAVWKTIGVWSAVSSAAGKSAMKWHKDNNAGRKAA